MKAFSLTFLTRNIDIIRRKQKRATTAFMVPNIANCMCNVSSEGLADATSHLVELSMRYARQKLNGE